MLSNNNRPQYQVAKIIASQMARGGIGQIAMMTGAKNFLTHSDQCGGLSFQFPRPAAGKPNFVRVTLTGMDTYTVEFGSRHGLNYRVLSTVEDVYAESLRGVFESATGLYLSL